MLTLMMIAEWLINLPLATSGADADSDVIMMLAEENIKGWTWQVRVASCSHVPRMATQGDTDQSFSDLCICICVCTHIVFVFVYILYFCICTHIVC